MKEEVKASHFFRYTSTYWNNQSQPYQDVDKQYNYYLEDGYDELFFKNINSHTPHFGVWITCFVAFLSKDIEVNHFLDTWYLQTLKYITQDQIGFSYVCQKTNIIPFTLPNNEIYGDYPQSNTMFYLKKITENKILNGRLHKKIYKNITFLIFLINYVCNIFNLYGKP